MEEIFKIVEGHEDYLISNYGRVLSNKRKVQAELKQRWVSLGMGDSL